MLEKEQFPEKGVATLHLPKLGFPFPPQFSDSVLLFQSYMWHRFAPSSRLPRTLLFVVRRPRMPGSPQKYRIIANEAEVGSLLRARAEESGFLYKECFLEDLNIEEQIKLFADVGVLVAQNGSGMANILWMRPGGHVIELGPYSPGGGKLCTFQSMCDVLRLQWRVCAAPGPLYGKLLIPLPELKAVMDSCDCLVSTSLRS